MAGKRITLADVAGKAGVAPSTASLVLSGRGHALRISEAAQERVRNAAQELKYRPNAISVGLRKGTTKTLGFVSNTVASSSLAGEMIKGAIEACRDAGFMLFVGETGGRYQQEELLIDAMMDRQVDGIIFASTFTIARQVPEALHLLPSVILNLEPIESTDIPVVLPDEYNAGRNAAELLIRKKHRSIHLLGAGPTIDDAPPISLAGHHRLRGILDVLAEHDLKVSSGQMDTHWLPPEGYMMTNAILDSGQPADALIAFNDRLAMGAYQAIQERGLSIPNDISIVSFDDASIAAWLRPSLTTFALPHNRMGKDAAALLISRVLDTDADFSTDSGHSDAFLISMPLRDRDSVR